MKSENYTYKLVATKVKPADREKFGAIAQGFNMTSYELVQALVLALVRYFDKDSLVTYEHNIMLTTFCDLFMSTGDSFNPLSLNGKDRREIGKAIVFVNSKQSDRPQVMAIAKDGKGNLTESYNVDKMLTDFLRATDPEVLKVLTTERERSDNFSLSHTLHDLVLSRAAKPADIIESEIKELFDDVRIPTGEKINGDVFYKRVFNHSENIDDYTAITAKSRYKRADIA